MIKRLLTFALVAVTITTQAQSGLANLDFENWTAGMPNGFFGMGVSQQTSGAQHGTSFARVTVNTPSGPSADGLMLIGPSIALRGAPYNQRAVSVSGYYKCYFATSQDTMAIGAAFTQNATTVASFNFYAIPLSQSAWTPFVLLFNYSNGNTPDTMQLIFYANTLFINNSANSPGSYLDIDNLSIDLSSGIPFEATGILPAPYPDPATSYVILSSPDVNARNVKVFDLTGRLVNNYRMDGQSAEVDVNSYENGLYTYYITDKQDVVLRSGKFVVAR